MKNLHIYKLPCGWSRTSLAEFSDIILGQSPPSTTYNTQKEGLPFYQGKSEFGVLYPTPRVWCSTPSKIAEKGDILISVRAPVGPTNICPSKSCIGRGLAAIRPTYGVQSLFILYLIRAFEQQLTSQGTGTTFKAINGNQLRSFSVPVPPLAEQKRIVAKIEELFTKLDAGVEALKKVKAELKRYRQAVLKAAFEGKLTAEWRRTSPDTAGNTKTLIQKICNEKAKYGTSQITKSQKSLPMDLGYTFPKVWKTMTLADISLVVTDGDHQPPPKAINGIPFLVISNIRDGFLDFSNTRFVAESYFENIPASKKPKLNDILYSVTGSFGIPLIVNTTNKFCFQRHIALIRPTHTMNLKFLYYCLKSEVVLNQAKSIATGTAQLTVPLTGLRNITIPIPCEIEQFQIAEEIERCFSIADEVEQTIERSLKEAGRLRQSILKKAFEGKLVPQDVNDEPANVLLERITQQKTPQQGIAKTQKKVKPKIANVKTRKHSKGIYFHRGAVLSYIVDKLCDNDTFGRTQLEKIVHLTQYHLGIDLEFEFTKEAAGPFDEEIIKVESLARKEGWFNVLKRNDFGYYYKRGKKIDGRCSVAETILGKQKSEMDRLISMFSKMKTDQAEIFDTVYAVWNDMLIVGIEPTEDKIKDNFYSWSKEKKRFTTEQIHKCIEWIKKNKFIPSGQGSKTKCVEYVDIGLAEKPKRKGKK